MWDNFIYFALPSLLLWGAGAYAAWKEKSVIAYATTLVGIMIFFAYILMMWVTLERPPLRTMGETRLWYSFFLPLAGIVIYMKWKYKWVLSFSTLMALVFVCINIFKPEIHSKTLMPALQSPWFAPHVIVYMFAYSLFGISALLAVGVLCQSRLAARYPNFHIQQSLIDNLVNVGLSFLTLGMLMGAVWAKDAWGHYWAWDPKETWAAVTWFAYLAFIHLRLIEHGEASRRRWAMILLIVNFVLLQMCWWGINYLPSAQGMSVHTYSLS